MPITKSQITDLDQALELIDDFARMNLKLAMIKETVKAIEKRIKKDTFMTPDQLEIIAFLIESLKGDIPADLFNQPD